MTHADAVCPDCGVENPRATCWRCGADCANGTGAAPSRPPARVLGLDTISRGWMVTLCLVVLVTMAITVELARVGPGWLLLFAPVALPVLALLVSSARHQGEITALNARIPQRPIVSVPRSRPTARSVGLALVGLGSVFWAVAALLVLVVAFVIVVAEACSQF